MKVLDSYNYKANLYKIFDEDTGEIVKYGSFAEMQKVEDEDNLYSLGDGFYYDLVKGFYFDNDGEKEFLKFKHSNLFIFFDVDLNAVDSSRYYFLVGSGYLYLYNGFDNRESVLSIDFYRYFDAKNNLFLFDEEFVGDDEKKYYLYLKMDFDSLEMEYYFYTFDSEDNKDFYCLMGDQFLIKFMLLAGLKFFPLYNAFYVMGSISIDANKDLVDNLHKFLMMYSSTHDDIVQQIKNISTDGIEVDLSSVTDKLDEVLNKVSSIDLSSLDLTPITEKIDELMAKMDSVDKIEDITNYLDEKLMSGLQLISLNGSNGAKYSDGDKVKVIGFDDTWIVKSSHHVLVKENTQTVVYVLTNGDKVLLVPASLIEV